MLEDLIRTLNLSVGDTALLAVAAVVLALFAVTLAFSAYAIALRVHNDRRSRLWAHLGASWEEPVLDAISDPARIPDAQKLVEKRYELHFVHFVLEYSRRMRGAERTVLRQLVEPFLPEIARRAGHSNEQVRTRAMQTLGTLGLPKYADEVLRGLEDPSPLVSFVAARYLASREYPQYGVPVLDQLGRFKQANYRFLASMIASIGPAITPELRRRLSDVERPSWERAVISEALTMQLDPAAGDIAAELLETAEDRELILRLLRQLAIVGRREHLPVIRSRSIADDPLVRAQALGALGRLGDERDLPLLIAAMDDDSPWVALHAARGVREAGGRGVLEELSKSDLAYASLAGQVLYEEIEA